MSQKTVRCDSNNCKGVSQELGVEITWNSTGQTEVIQNVPEQSQLMRLGLIFFSTS